MRLSRSHPLFSILLLAAALPLRASPPDPLSLEAALARAAADNPSLRAAQPAVRAAEALADQAGLRPNPTLDLSLENALGTGGLRGTRALEATVQLSQTLERGDKRARRTALAHREREVATGEVALRHTEVLAAAAEAFITALAAQERRALADEPLRLARETLTAANARVQAGAAPAAEAARARAALATAETELAQAEASLARARVTLAASWGGSPDDVPAVAGRLHLPAALPDAASLRASLAGHPALALQRTAIDRERAALDLEQAQARQDVTVGGGVRFLREGNDAAFVAGLSVPLPVRNRNQGAIRAAREHVAGAELQRDATEADLRARFTAAWQDLRAAHAAASRLRRDALPATEEAHASVRRAYEEGHLPFIDVLDAQRSLAALRRDLLDAETAYALALVRVESLASPAFPLTTTLLSAQ